MQFKEALEKYSNLKSEIQQLKEAIEDLQGTQFEYSDSNAAICALKKTISEKEIELSGYDALTVS